MLFFTRRQQKEGARVLDELSLQPAAESALLPERFLYAGLVYRPVTLTEAYTDSVALHQLRSVAGPSTKKRQRQLNLGRAGTRAGCVALVLWVQPALNRPPGRFTYPLKYLVKDKATVTFTHSARGGDQQHPPAATAVLAQTTALAARRQRGDRRSSTARLANEAAVPTCSSLSPDIWAPRRAPPRAA